MLFTAPAAPETATKQKPKGNMSTNGVKNRTIEELRGLMKSLKSCNLDQVDDVCVPAALFIRDSYMEDITYGYFEGDFAEGLLEIVHEIESDPSGSTAFYTLESFIKKHDETDGDTRPRPGDATADLNSVLKRMHPVPLNGLKAKPGSDES